MTPRDRTTLLFTLGVMYSAGPEDRQDTLAEVLSDPNASVAVKTALRPFVSLNTDELRNLVKAYLYLLEVVA